jgi:tetratricopeptide (TPR) repeat protein
VKADAKHARAWYNLGLALHQQGRSAEAIAALRQGESADPNDGAIAYARATILYPMGRRDEALAAVEAALRAQPQLREAQQLRALILSGQ